MEVTTGATFQHISSWINDNEHGCNVVGKMNVSPPEKKMAD
jgi:hypothetical protein